MHLYSYVVVEQFPKRTADMILDMTKTHNRLENGLKVTD